jgi:hypothetical protein
MNFDPQVAVPEATATRSNLQALPSVFSTSTQVLLSDWIGGAGAWRLIDAAGRTVRTGRVPAGARSFGLDGAGLPNGAYTLLVDADRATFHLRVVKAEP